MNHPNPPPQNPNQEEPSPPKFEWDFHVSAVVSSPATGQHISDTLGVIEVNSSGTLFATGGIARKIRIYNLNSLPPITTHATACRTYICTPAKLSSLKWKPGSAGKTMGSADYDGVVTEYDLETQMPVFERDEHSGRRVWSMDYSNHLGSVVGASGSDDGTMQMWDPRHESGKCVAAVQFGGPVCCVEFSSFNGTLLAVGCADTRAYVYDVRKMVEPVAVFDGHKKTVSYTRFLDDRTVMTSGTDGCLKMWDTEDQSLIRTYKGHTNQRRFVGLSVWRNQGLIGCGSESNQVFVYDKRWGEPIWVHEFEPEGGTRSEHRFVSSICWSQVGDDECTLVGGGSDGVVKIFSGKRKQLTSDI
ncbi:putative transcription factor WD40-like family [Helianthus annuus]|nr:putative transcription factor WD40-like family [Helianthus annuus]KAJ0542196.1 putative transcription factor WD40-like family [Helianthus annuus]KAJ0887968.1 putative transcription factor WD40-like family [Helianthus annuus]